MLRDNRVLMILSLLISVALWVYVMGNVDPNIEAHISSIPVSAKGTESLDNKGITAKLESPKEIDIVISGKRSEVNKAKKKEFKATVDVSTCEMGTNVAPIEVKIPSGVRGVIVESMTDEVATFLVE